VIFAQVADGADIAALAPPLPSREIVAELHCVLTSAISGRGDGPAEAARQYLAG
jgi:hypothetical protein